MFVFTLVVGFIIGALTIIAVEALGVVVVLGRLNKRVKNEESKAASHSPQGLSEPHSSYYKKQGVVWVLEPEKVPKAGLVDKAPREKKRKKEIFEVSPVQKYAKVKGQSLILTNSDGSYIEIQLKGCTIAAVSATTLFSKKWAKKYPIKVESKTVLYSGNKTVYIYLETSWEKESWCKALRLASSNDKEKLKWFSKLNVEFQSYLTTLNTGYPSFMKPSVGVNAESIDRQIKVDGSSSKVRHFLKKLAKKASKSGVENKSTSGLEERKISEKSYSFQDSVSGTGVVKATPIGKTTNLSVEDKTIPSSPSTLAHTGSSTRSHISVFSDVDSDDKIGSDEGTLCWNLLIARLFFDAKSNTDIKNFMQARIQRTLSNMRIPSYMGDLTCTGIDLGSLPPYINCMRVLPSDMNEVWALEIDIRYSSGVVINIETRLEVQELGSEEGMMDTNLESSSVGEVTSDLLEGFEYFGKQLELSEGTLDAAEHKDEPDLKLDGMQRCKSTNRGSSSTSRWKSILNSIAKQVSQVPLSLSIRVASLKGTLRLHIKPPPSDQLWFGFSSTPDIDFNLESSVGDHKINSGHIALFLVNRFKTAIREALVLPNCESICIPWMLAEKDDWVPRNVAPFLWVKQEAVVDHPPVAVAVAREIPSSQPAEATPIPDATRETTSDIPKVKHDKRENVDCFQQSVSESSVARASLSDPANQSTWSIKSQQELSVPLLNELQSTCEGSEEENPGYQSPSQSLTREQIQAMEGDDARLKRSGTRRARMLGLGKKMGEKLEEKRRHIEEKGRHIVERMRGP
ncbi:Testis-expressed protein 2 [Camellia lanceoleosa]|uniref:Testis-expressed protein 2 n=1 Tax=Camellia lanceoleosa TaxID=1840588 RepID=A0ACC0F8W6_9ERIC|nr:Testis-expressed protein 2 [Camellia lanceoleosa]